MCHSSIYNLPTVSHCALNEIQSPYQGPQTLSHQTSCPALSNLNQFHSPQVHHLLAQLVSFQFIKQLFPTSCPLYMLILSTNNQLTTSQPSDLLTCCLQREIYKTRTLRGQAIPVFLSFYLFFSVIVLNQFIIAYSSIISLSSCW